MYATYLPQKLSDFNVWFLNFSTLITANPLLYGVTAGDASTIAAAQADFASKYAISTAPATRSPVTVQDTITARNTGVQIIRSYARQILANAGVADADKVALGLKIRDTVNTPIPAPATNPVLTLLGATPGQITANYRDSAASPGVKAKPFGAVAMQLYVAFGVMPVTPDATPFRAQVSRTPFAIDTTEGTPGQTAWVYGRWVTAKGLVGPWSPVASMVIV